MLKINIFIKIKNIKFPKIIIYNNNYYIYGINSVTFKSFNKFILECYKYDINFNFIKKLNINHKFKKSTLIWQIIEKKIILYF